VEDNHQGFSRRGATQYEEDVVVEGPAYCDLSLAFELTFAPTSEDLPPVITLMHGADVPPIRVDSEELQWGYCRQRNDAPLFLR
jgi:hypothetical protein